MRDRSGALSTVWRTWTAVVSSSRAIGEQRASLRLATASVRGDVGARNDVLDSWLLKNLDAQQWSGRVLRAVDSCDMNAATPIDILSQLQTFLSAMPRRPVPISVRIKKILYVLSLPIWQKREAFYSAWVGAKIVESMGPETSILSSEGRISFGFGGSHLASLADGERRVHLWCELRSPLSNPTGKGRTSSIQPDYVVVTEPISYVESGILVVEVKQYLKASRRNFLAAVRDYAHGRPKATVLLVNYGKIPDNYRTEIEPQIANRVHLIHEFHPDSALQIEEFRRLCTLALGPITQPPTEAIATNQGMDSTPATPQGGFRVELSWDKPGVDLDLHTWVKDENAKEYWVNYKWLGSREQAPRVWLNKDCQTGPGTETINIAGKVIEFACCVHCFKGASDLKEVGCRVMIRRDGLLEAIECTPSNPGPLWHVVHWRSGEKCVILSGTTGRVPPELERTSVRG
jgi:hypothetical protein